MHASTRGEATTSTDPVVVEDLLWASMGGAPRLGAVPTHRISDATQQGKAPSGFGGWQ